MFASSTSRILARNLRQRIKMLKYQQSRLEMEPLKGNEIVSSSANLDYLDFRVVLFKGVYDEEKSILVHRHLKRSSGETENGYNLITPLIPVPGLLKVDLRKWPNHVFSCI